MVIKTEKDVKSMVNNAENINVIQALFEAVAYCETIRDVIEPKQQEIVSFYKFKVADEWREKKEKHGRTLEFEVIEHPKHMYLSSEEDFQIYMKELKAFYKEKGLKVKRDGNCPLLEAESMVRDIKMHVADHFEPYFGFGYHSVSHTLDGYRKYYDLLMTMFAPFVKNNYKK